MIERRATSETRPGQRGLGRENQFIFVNGRRIEPKKHDAKVLALVLQKRIDERKAGQSRRARLERAEAEIARRRP